MLSDGSQIAEADVEDPGFIAEELRSQMGITVIVVGIGAGVNQAALDHIA